MDSFQKVRIEGIQYPIIYSYWKIANIYIVQHIVRNHVVLDHEQIM